MTTESAAPTPAKRPGRGLRIALAVSVAINLGILGLVAGAMLRDGPRGMMVRELDFGPFTEAFSDRDRAALREAFVQRAPSFRDMRQEMRADADRLIAALRADPLDPAELQAALAQQQARMQARIDQGRDLVLERITAMTPEARRDFADRLEHALRRGSRGQN